MRSVWLYTLGLLIGTGWAEDSRPYHGYSVHRFQVVDAGHAELLKGLWEMGAYDFWSEIIIGRWTDIMTSPTMEKDLLDWAEDNEIRHEVMIQDVQVLVDQEKRSDGKKNAAGHSMDWLNYHTLADIHGYLDYLESSFDFCSTESIGKSYLGKDMVLMKVCRGGCGNKPAMWIDAGIHAREWISPAAVTWMLMELVEHDAQHPHLTQQLDWYFLASHNPDGYEHTWNSYRMWRKTKSKYAGDICEGTDANRNWDYHWGEGGAGTDSCSETYRGPSAFSEIEARNVRDFILKQNNTVKFYNNVHSYSQLILLPWGYSTEPTPDHDAMEDLAIRGNRALFAAHGKEYTIGCIPCVLYVASGNSLDWAYGVAKIPYVYSFELRDKGNYGFLLPADQIIPTGEETWAFHKVAAEQIIQEFSKQNL